MQRTAVVGSLICAIVLSVASAGAAEAPKVDKAGSVDSPLVKRYQGSVIVAYERKDFDEFVLPLSKLEPVPGKKDSHNFPLFESKTSMPLEGRRTRLIYLIPPDRSVLEVVRNYQDEIKQGGGKVLYECKGADCGGGYLYGNVLDGQMCLAKFLYPPERNSEPGNSPGYCAMSVPIGESRYTAMALPSGAGHVSVMAYTTSPILGGPCLPFGGRTFATVDVLEAKPREQKMVTVKAADMAEAISSGGKVALYGIYFNTGKADLQSASNETLEQIGKLLKEKPALKLVVVGHTDNEGSFTSNIDLSQRRAVAVVAALATRYGVNKERLVPLGVSSAAPVASNKTEEGRAKNRRVELVER
jgi:OOP family OmpA-OmpF porin